MRTRCGSFLAIALATFTGARATVEAEDFRYITNSGGTISIMGYDGPAGAISIPDTINGLPVTCIGPIPPSGGFRNVTSVAIPSSVTSLEAGAFHASHSLTNISIPGSVTNIGNAAFMLCTSLASIELPDSVTSIGSSAFQQCASLVKILIPRRVTFIAGPAFRDCISLSAVEVDPLNPAYSSVDGVLCNKEKTSLLEYPGGKVGSYTVPAGITNIAGWAFGFCSNLTRIALSPSVVSIGDSAFDRCVNLSSVTLSDSLVSIGRWAFMGCTGLKNITIPANVASLGSQGFSDCTGLTGVYFQGNAPKLDDGGWSVFLGLDNVFVYYLFGTSGWGQEYAGRTTVLLDPPTTSPGQTAEVGDAVRWRVGTVGPAPLFWLWYHNGTNLVLCSTNANLRLTNLQSSQAGVYTAVLTNTGWAATSSPAMLQVVTPVQRRPVPGIKVRGEVAGLMNLDYADSLAATPEWTPLGTVSVTNALQYSLDLSVPLPPQRFYRGWQTGAPGVVLSLDLQMVPEITVAGEVGEKVKLEYINRLGPIDAWAPLATITLASPSELYFDVSALRQPARLYRITRVP